MARRVVIREPQTQSQSNGQASASGPAVLFDWIWNGSNTGLECIKGNAPIVGRRVGVSIAAGSHGLGILGDGINYSWSITGFETGPGAANITGAYSTTVLALVEFTSLAPGGGAEYSVIRADQTPDGTESYALDYFVDSGPTFRVRPLVRTVGTSGWTTLVDVTLPFMPKVGTLYVFGMRYSSGASHQVCLAPVGGPLVWYSAGLIPAGPFASTGVSATTHFLGAGNTTVNVPPVRLYGAAVAKRAVPDSAIQQLVRNPWVLLDSSRTSRTFALANLITAGSSISPLYNIRGVVASNTAAAYSVRQTTANLAAPVYNVRGSATRASNLSYVVKQYIQNSALGAYNVRQASSRGILEFYNVREATSKPVAQSFNVRQFSGNSRAQGYAVRASVSVLNASLYQVRQFVAGSRSPAYFVLQAADKTSPQSYLVRQSSSNSLSTLYQIFGGAAVGRSWVSAYNIRSAVSTTTSLSYQVLQSVQFGNTFTYVIRTNSSSSKSQTFVVRAVSSNFQSSNFNVRQLVSSDKISQYNIVGVIPVGMSRQIIYEILGEILNENLVIVVIEEVSAKDIVISEPEIVTIKL